MSLPVNGARTLEYMYLTDIDYESCHLWPTVCLGMPQRGQPAEFYCRDSNAPDLSRTGWAPERAWIQNGFLQVLDIRCPL